MANPISGWRAHSAAVIRAVHAELPADATLKDRMAAVDAAYPFGQRKYHPYKMWLKERALYLARYGYEKRGKPLHETPLERLMRRSGGKND